MRRVVHLCLALSIPSIAACAVEEDGEEFMPRAYEEHADKCVHTQGYWKTHNKYATKKNLQDPWPLSEDNSGCGNTWLGWLNTPPEGHPLTILGHQWIAAQLNWASHAPMPQNVRDALFAGGAFLAQCDFEQEDRDEILAISELLDAYNNGLAGPPHCE
jgi:hypothetical protein